jgi:hypothetical protein
MLAVLAAGAVLGYVAATGKLYSFEQPARADEAAAPAKITIVVPADATITFDGNPTSERGTERVFDYDCGLRHFTSSVRQWHWRSHRRQ